MKFLKRVILGIIVFISITSLLLIVTDNSHLFKGLSSTYLVGKTGPSIDEHNLFESREVLKGNYQPWEFSPNYNKKESEEFTKELEKYDPAGFLISKNNQIVYEKYWEDYNENSLTNSFSVAKTFIGLLIGIAIDEGKITGVEAPVSDYLPEYSDHPELTIKHLLTMSSGINFDESYNSPFGHMAKAYYGDNIKKLNEDYTVTETPGKKWKYLGGNTIILALIIERVTGNNISEYMSKKVWQPIGAKNTALWSLDEKGGREKSYCCFYSNLRDFARIGQLYLNNGTWNNHRIITEKYIKASTTPAYELKDKSNNSVNFYGYQMWMTDYKDLEIFYARGIKGQYIIMVPEKQIVIVRLGRNRGRQLENHQPSELYTFIDFALEQ